MSRICAAIFDLDGTLLDSMWVWDQVDRDFFASRGLPLPPDYMDAVHSMGFSEAARYTIDRFGLSETPESLMEEWNRMAIVSYANQVPLKPGALELLRDLKNRNFRLGIATACAEELFMPALRRHGIIGLFDTILSTAEAGCGKDSPRIFQLTASRMGAPADLCIVFEDDLAGLISAKKAGMFTCAVYDRYAAAQEEQIRHTADYYITDFTQACLRNNKTSRTSN